MGLLPKFAALVIAIFSMLFITQSANAVTPTISPEEVTENSTTVTVTFDVLESGKTYHYCLKGNALDCVNNLHPASAENEKIILTVCGDGSENLKINCGPNDYFHPSSYKVGLFIVDGTDLNLVTTAQFDVNRFIPNPITFESTLKPNEPITINVTGSRHPFNNKNRNNYQIAVKGINNTQDPNIDNCFEVPPNGTGTGSVALQTGDYEINIVDQVNESSECQGDDFEYKTWRVEIREAGGRIVSETGANTFGSGRNPCGPAGCQTALGLIPTTMAEFASTFLSVAVGIAGGAALILMVLGAVQVLTSSGDQQRLSGGRDRIVSAVAGLLFLIFAVVILRFIGLNILGGVPGVS